MISRPYAVVAQLDRASAFEAEALYRFGRLFSLCHECTHEDARATRAFNRLRRRLIWQLRLRKLFSWL